MDTEVTKSPSCPFPVLTGIIGSIVAQFYLGIASCNMWVV